MTNIHPRRAQAESEAAAWLDLHSDWAAGLPAAEVPSVSVRGRLFHDHIGDGWGSVGHQAPAKRIERPSKTTVRNGVRVTRITPTQTAPLQDSVPCVPDSAYDESLPTISRESIRLQPAFLFDSAFHAPDHESQRWALGARRSALGQLDRTGHLAETTTVIGQRVPTAMLYDVAADCAIRKTTRVVHTSAFDKLPEPIAPSIELAQLAADELIEWLRLEVKLTDKEVQAIERRAAGEPQPTRSDRDSLCRAVNRFLGYRSEPVAISGPSYGDRYASAVARWEADCL